ncbi:hypothetical protein D3C86_495690 [compost metagenome]
MTVLNARSADILGLLSGFSGRLPCVIKMSIPNKNQIILMLTIATICCFQFISVCGLILLTL